MELRSLLSGIAVVIDDALVGEPLGNGVGGEEGGDLIVEIVKQIGDEWKLPFYTSQKMPPRAYWPSLLRAASFVMLDWRLWPRGAAELERSGIEDNVRFLESARKYFVPVFVFTNEDKADVIDALPPDIYREGAPVFIQDKGSLLDDGELNFDCIGEWIGNNASVYVLKTWDQSVYEAKTDLFGSMYSRNPDWPRVFWESYEADGVDPSSSLTHLINDSLRGRIPTNRFEQEILGVAPVDVPRDDLRAMIGETSLQSSDTLSADEIRCGDLYRQPNRKYLLNIRPDCDCVPRDGNAGDVDLYCIEGKVMTEGDVQDKYYRDGGHFPERVWESIVFSIHERRSVRFDFRRFSIRKYGELMDARIGRVLHPYLTRIQQRFGLYLQRQGLPRIPESAVPLE